MEAPKASDGAQRSTFCRLGLLTLGSKSRYHYYRSFNAKMARLQIFFSFFFSLLKQQKRMSSHPEEHRTLSVAQQ